MLETLEFRLNNNKTIPVHFVKTTGKNIIIRPYITPIWYLKITIPKYATQQMALHFLEERKEWINKFFYKQLQKTVIEDGTEIRFLDDIITIKHNPHGRYGVCLENKILSVCGSKDMMEHRAKDFIKKEFLKYLKSEIKEINKTYPYCPKRISIKDTSSRWGSCSSSGNLNFSWRLAFAPKWVVRYVIIHELAHFKHMNHSEQFWLLVYSMYGSGVERAKKWLNQNGSKLHTIF